MRVNNSSTNKEIAGQKKFFELKKGVEKTIVFPATINQIEIVAAVNGGDYIRINSGANMAEDNDNSYMFTASMASFPLISSCCFSDLSLLSSFDCKIQLVCPRSLS